MTTFILRRLLAGVVLIFIVTALTFLLIYAGGNDIAFSILGESATPEAAAALSTQLGLDRPIFVQYWDWLTSALTGDLGTSFFGPASVATTLGIRIPVTLSLVAVSIVLTAVLGVILGVASARRGGWVDRVTQVISVVGFALPSYWLALVLVLTIALPMPWLFPATGYVAPTVSVGAWLMSIALPAIALTIGGVATIAQQVRGSMIDTMRLDFVRTLRSRGIPERNIVYRHALRSSAGPALTVLSLQFIGMLGGAIIIERVFALPGIGSLAATASLRGDIPVVMGVVAFSVFVVVVVNLLVDITQGILNPKVRTA